MAYREHTTRTRPNEVVRYRPASLMGALIFMTVLMALAGVVLVQALEALRRIELTCDRGTNVCMVCHHYGPYASERPIAASRIHAITLRTLRNKKSTTYAVTLFTKDGVAIDLLQTPLQSQGASVRAAAEALSTGPSAAITTQEGSPISALLYSLVAAGIVAVSLLGLRTAHLEFDFDRGIIAYSRYRWPLPPAKRLFTIASVEAARVSVTGTRRVVEVELVIEDEPNFRLVAQNATSGEDHNKTASKINELLADMRRLHET